jgi:hypothetical protein
MKAEFFLNGWLRLWVKNGGRYVCRRYCIALKRYAEKLAKELG